MIWKYYPSNEKPNEDLLEIIDAFTSIFNTINSSTNNLKSDQVLNKLSPYLVNMGYDVEKSKKNLEKVRVPVLYGFNGEETLSFEADAYSYEKNVVIEVEAGRAVTNYQFLKDFFQACMMCEVKYVCIAVRKIYRKNKDFDKVCSFFDAMYASGRISIPLKGVMIVGY